MLEVDGRSMSSRVKGRQAIERSMRALIIRVHRFGTRRTHSAADRLWSARAIDTLTDLLDTGRPTPSTDVPASSDRQVRQ
jgi:hypothetical protein